MTPIETTFASLIGIEGNQWHYHIPRFQREYVWGKDNWSKLIEDIYENDPGHYMGSVICVNDKNETSPNDELVYEVVDGQHGSGWKDGQVFKNKSQEIRAAAERHYTMVGLNLQPATNKASIGRKAAFGLRHIAGLMPPSPSSLRSRCDVGNPATSCVC